jgi:hypothetical protein
MMFQVEARGEGDLIGPACFVLTGHQSGTTKGTRVSSVPPLRLAPIRNTNRNLFATSSRSCSGITRAEAVRANRSGFLLARSEGNGQDQLREVLHVLPQLDSIWTKFL